jgi:hypothetical protein
MTTGEGYQVSVEYSNLVYIKKRTAFYFLYNMANVMKIQEP